MEDDDQRTRQKGFIYLHRSLLDNPLWTLEPFSRGQAWVDLIYLAQYRESTLQTDNGKIVVPRGSVFRTQRFLASRWHWSRGKVQRWLAELTQDRMITCTNTKKYKLINICNYDSYQGIYEAKKTTTVPRNSDDPLVSSEDMEPDAGPDTVPIQVNIINNNKGLETANSQKSANSFGTVIPDVLNVHAIALKGGAIIEVQAVEVDRYRRTFPHLDVDQQLREIALYFETRPDKKCSPWQLKTFIANWLRNAQARTSRSFTPDSVPGESYEEGTERIGREAFFKLNGHYPDDEPPGEGSPVLTLVKK